MGVVTKKLYADIRNNRENGVIQYDIGMPKLMKYCDGVRKGVATVIGATSGSGKTTMALYCYVYRPIMDCIERNSRDLKIIIFCLELKDSDTMSKLMSMYLYEKYGIEMSLRDLYSFSGPISNERMKIIDEAEGMMEKIESYIKFVEGDLTVSNLTVYLGRYFGKIGVFTEKGQYLPNPGTENLVSEVLIDHLGEVTCEGRQTPKDAQDGIVNVLKKYKNLCGLSSVVLQQINRMASTTDRRTKFPGLELNDLKSTGCAAEKADNVIGLYNPYREKLKTIGGYDVSKLKQCLRLVQVLKNRYGISDLTIGAGFYGAASIIAEIPKGEDITDYDRYLTPKWIEDDRRLSEELKI